MKLGTLSGQVDMDHLFMSGYGAVRIGTLTEIGEIIITW